MGQRTPLGDRFRELRRDRGYTLRRLAEDIGLDHTYLSKIENGADVPSEDTLRRIEEFFGVQSEELVALAGKVPAELSELARRDTRMGRLLRRLPDLPKETIDRIYEQAGVETDEADR